VNREGVVRTHNSPPRARNRRAVDKASARPIGASHLARNRAAKSSCSRDYSVQACRTLWSSAMFRNRMNGFSTAARFPPPTEIGGFQRGGFVNIK
jgi:hypothetical protein